MPFSLNHCTTIPYSKPGHFPQQNNQTLPVRFFRAKENHTVSDISGQIHGNGKIESRNIDSQTNDFPRNDKGDVDTEDFYIPCRTGAEISHYGRDILDVLIPSITRGRKLIKLCRENNIELYSIHEGDAEVSFRFHAKDIHFIADYLQAKTQGKNIRPFSLKNLPESDYVIPSEEMEEYKKIISCVPKENVLVISQVTKNFMEKKLAKKYKRVDIESDMRKKKMSRQTKEYIHSMGEWNNYLNYLNKEIKKRLEK